MANANEVAGPLALARALFPVCLALGVGCGEPTPAASASPSPEPALIEVTEALASGGGSVAAVRAQLTSAVAFIERDPGRPEAVRVATLAGRAALAIVEHGEFGADLARVQRVLARVTEEVGLPGLCEALLVRAELARALEVDLSRDLAQLDRLMTRFGDSAADAPCVRAAGRLRDRWRGQTPAAEPSQTAQAWLSAQTRGQTGTTTLLGVEVFGQRAADTGETRVVLSFDRPATYRRSERAAEQGLPRRVSIDLDGVAIAPQLPPHIPLQRGGVDRLRILSLEGAHARVSFDLQATTEYRMFFLPNPYRLVFDFRAARRVERAHGLRRVVLDPGHGGRNPGAKGPSGLRESDVALSLARRVRHALERKLPGVEVLLTRDGDYEVSLEERAAIANGVDADLFVSLHLNASGSPEDRGGVSTFVLDTSNDEQALRLAARENDTGTQDITALQVVLASLHRNDQVQQSRSAARAIHHATLTAGRSVLPQLPDRGVKAAMFYVLVGAMMPAVLVEASFITRPDEEAALRSDGYRAALADGIAMGIERYAARLARSH